MQFKSYVYGPNGALVPSILDIPDYNKSMYGMSLTINKEGKLEWKHLYPPLPPMPTNPGQYILTITDKGKVTWEESVNYSPPNKPKRHLFKLWGKK